MSTESALARVAERIDTYRDLARLLGAPAYPASNTCTRCEQISNSPLIPSRDAWHCHRCTYNTDPSTHTGPSGAVNPGDMPTPQDGVTCRACGQGCWHPDSQQRGTCARCHKAADRT